MIYCDKMGHMISDTSLDELHEFAAKIGMKREWFQDKEGHPHYDLMGNKMYLAVKNGAKLVDAREIVRIIRGQRSE